MALYYSVQMRVLGSGKEAREDQRDSYVLNDSSVLADMNEGD